MDNSEKLHIPFFLLFSLLLWLLIGALLSLELVVNVMQTLPLLRVSSGFVFTVSISLVSISLVLLIVSHFARQLFVMGLWLITVMAGPGVYVIHQFLDRQGVDFAVGGVIYLLVYILMIIVVVYSSAALTRGGMTIRQANYARAPMLFVSTMCFVLISAATVFFIPIPAQQCGTEKIYRYKLGLYACDLTPHSVNGETKIRGCYKSVLSFKQDKLAYIRVAALDKSRCN